MLYIDHEDPKPKTFFAIPKNHPAIEVYREICSDISDALKLCGSYSHTLLLYGVSEKLAKPVIAITCEYPTKFVEVKTELPYVVSEGKIERGVW